MKILLFILFSFSFLPNIIYTSVSFVMNPGCNELQCKRFGYPALYYANYTVDGSKIHIFYSSFDELTISIVQTGENNAPVFNYSALFEKNYTNAIQFIDTKPVNSFSLILRRLVQFNDSTDNATMSDYDNTTISYFLNNLTTDSITFLNNETDQPIFQVPLNELNGWLNISIEYPGETIRETKFPKLKVEPKSFFLNIALEAYNYTLIGTRFAFELLLTSHGMDGYKISSQKNIDDQYTPGIFSVWQMNTLSSSYPVSMLWKPVVYQTSDRSVEDTTLMQISPIKNNITLNPIIDKGIFYSFLRQPNVSSFVVSLGQSGDGFYSKANYSFIQFTGGLDVLQPDSTGTFVAIALIISLALPIIVAIIALIFILKRRFSRQSSNGYDSIQN